MEKLEKMQVKKFSSKFCFSLFYTWKNGLNFFFFTWLKKKNLDCFLFHRWNKLLFDLYQTWSECKSWINAAELKSVRLDWSSLRELMCVLWLWPSRLVSSSDTDVEFLLTRDVWSLTVMRAELHLLLSNPQHLDIHPVLSALAKRDLPTR